MKKRLSYNAGLLVISVAAVLSLLPVVFVFTNSFMSATEAAARYTSQVTPYSSFGVISGDVHYVDMGFLPDLISLSGWWQILVEEPSNLRFMWNSILLAVPIVVGQLVLAPLAAYGLERVKARHKDKLFFAYIIIMLLPMQALLVPHFIAARFFGMDGGYLAIILPALFSPFGVFLVRQQMKGFEKGIIEAANIDGTSDFQAYLRVVLPNMKSTLTALAVLAFAEAWNIVDQAVVFLRDKYRMPMSVYLSASLTENVGIVFALSALFMIPALIIFIYGQDDLSDGIGYSGRK